MSQDVAGEIIAENLLYKYIGYELRPDGALHIEGDSDAVYRLVCTPLNARNSKRERGKGKKVESSS